MPKNRFSSTGLSTFWTLKKKTNYALIVSKTMRCIFALDSDVITAWHIKPQNREDLPTRPFPVLEDDLYFIFIPLSYESQPLN